MKLKQKVISSTLQYGKEKRKGNVQIKKSTKQSQPFSRKQSL